MEPLTKQVVLDLYFIEARARLLDLAAFLDRVERAPGEADFRLAALRAALEQMTSRSDGDGTRAKGVLMALSDPTNAPLDAATTKSATGAWTGSVEQRKLPVVSRCTASQDGGDTRRASGIQTDG